MALGALGPAAGLPPPLTAVGRPDDFEGDDFEGDDFFTAATGPDTAISTGAAATYQGEGTGGGVETGGGGVNGGGGGQGELGW